MQKYSLKLTYTVEPRFNKPGYLIEQNRHQNSIEPNQTPIVPVGLVIEPSGTSLLLWVLFIEPTEQNQMQSNSIPFDFVWNHFLISKSLSWSIIIINHY